MPMGSFVYVCWRSSTKFCSMRHLKALLVGIIQGRKLHKKVLRSRLWWTQLFEESKDYCKHYNVFQQIEKTSRQDELPLFLVIALELFEKQQMNLEDRSISWCVVYYHYNGILDMLGRSCTGEELYYGDYHTIYF
jgi:hypothetical protein